MKIKLEHHEEKTPFDCATCSIRSILSYYKIPAKSSEIEAVLKTGLLGTKVKNVELLFAKHGLSMKFVPNYIQLGWFLQNKIPVLAKRHLYRLVPHYCLVEGIDKNAIILNDPYFKGEQKVNYQKLKDIEMYAVLKNNLANQKTT